MATLFETKFRETLAEMLQLYNPQNEKIEFRKTKR